MVTTIPKKEAINFLIEKCYKNFPELIEMIPEGEMYNRLNENITIILGYSDNSQEDGASYWTQFKEIDIFGIQEGDTIEKIKHAIAHEGIHALFRKNNLDTGCDKDREHFFSGKKIVGIAKTSKKRFKSNKSILSEMKILKLLLSDKYYVKEFGLALNEGFTEWCTGKSVGKQEKAYLPQVRIIEILECILGTKEVLKIGDGNDSEIAKMLNMNITEYNVFMAQMDEILFLKEMQKKISISDKLTKKRKTIDEAKEFASDEIINTLTEKLIIPHFEQNSKPTLEDFKKLHKINNLINDFSKMNTGYANNLDTFLMAKLTDIINSGNFKVDELSFEDCDCILDYMIFTEEDGATIEASGEIDVEMDTITEEENSETSKAIDMLRARQDRISEERYPAIEEQIRALQRKDNQSINIYEINKILNSVQMTSRYQGNAINMLFQGKLTDEEKPKALWELHDIIYYEQEYNEGYYDEVFSRKYFTEENGFSIKKIEETNSKDNIQEENDTSIKFEKVEVKPTETVKTFFRRLIDKVIKFKNLTMEDIEQTRETEQIKEGEQEIE